MLHPGAASGLSSSISGLRPEEGLNGSNVPGLAFAHNNTNARSVPASRRTSGDDSADGQATGNLLGNHQQRQQQQQSQQAQRRSAADLVGAFNRMGLGPRGVSQLRAQLTESAGNSPGQPGNRGPLGNLSTSQQSALQRVLARSGSEPQNMAQQGAAGAANGAAGNNAGQPGEGFTPVFSERFLFDDELDAEDSAFVKKYVNMQEDDDKFPILVRRDSFPGMVRTKLCLSLGTRIPADHDKCPFLVQLSASSAALDLAPLSQTPPRFSRGHAGDGSKLSEWPQFAGRNSDAGVAGQGASEGHGNEAFADRRGRSERSSPRFGPVQGPGANRQSTFPLPSPSPRVPQTGRASPAISGSQGPARHTAPGTPAPGNGAEGHRGPPARFTSQGPHQLAGLSHNHFGNKTGNDEHHGPPGLPKGLSHPDLASVQQSAATGGSYRNAVPDGRRSGAGMRDSTFPSVSHPLAFGRHSRRCLSHKLTRFCFFPCSLAWMHSMTVPCFLPRMARRVLVPLAASRRTRPLALMAPAPTVGADPRLATLTPLVPLPAVLSRITFSVQVLSDLSTVLALLTLQRPESLLLVLPVQHPSKLERATWMVSFFLINDESVS